MPGISSDFRVVVSLFLTGFLRLPLYHVMAWVWIIGCRRDFLKGRWDGKNWLEMGAFKKRGDVICKSEKSQCDLPCYNAKMFWVFCLKFQVEIEIYSRPKTTTRNYEVFVPFEMEENTYSKPAFLEKHGSDGNPPHGQEKGPSICSAVRMFGDYDL